MENNGKLLFHAERQKNADAQTDQGQKTQRAHTLQLNSAVNKVWRTGADCTTYSNLLLLLLMYRLFSQQLSPAFLFSWDMQAEVQGVIHSLNLEEIWTFGHMNVKLHNLRNQRRWGLSKTPLCCKEHKSKSLYVLKWGNNLPVLLILIILCKYVYLLSAYEGLCYSLATDS